MQSKNNLFWLAVAAAMAVIPQSQPPATKPADAMNSAFKLQQQGKYLPAVDVLEKAWEKSSGDDRDSLNQQLAAAVSFVSEDERAIALFDGMPDPEEDASVPASSPLNGATAEDAISAIAREARGRQIVILNEAHHVPRCRAFGLQLARALRKEGFTYFAAETFGPDIDRTWQKRYPSLSTGYYTIEPLFGDFVRQVIRMGYKPIAYEAIPTSTQGDGYDQINRREIGEANHLVERLFKPHPDARVFIYCGYSHATKDWRTLKDGREFAWMAARLKRLTGIDPLTIDQTGAMPHSRPGKELPEYRYATAKGWVHKPTVFKLAGGRWGVFGNGWKDRVDMQVFSPRETLVGDRPDWLSMNGYRKPYLFAYTLAPNEGKALLQAFVASEPSDAIPMDQIVIEVGKPVPSLMLPRGKYHIVVQNAAGDSHVLGELQQK